MNNPDKIKLHLLPLVLCLALVLSIAALFACGCGNGNAKSGTPHESAQGIEDRYTRDSEKIVNFAKGDSSDFYRADGYGNQGIFNCNWSADNAVISQGTMNMSLSRGANGYLGAEYRSNETYSFGFYSVSMKAIKCSGVISSFFTYTNKPQWDEIDIEFVGKDTTKVQFNYFVNGAGGHEYLFDLGFDASAGFHEYAFDWQTDYIVWYVDGKAVYKVTKDIPQNSGCIMMNVWNPIGMDGWAGAFDSSALPVTAQYAWIGYGSEKPTTPAEPTTPSEPSKPSEPTTPDKPSASDKLTPDGDKVANFANGAAGGFSKSDGWSNGGMFNCTWRQNNVNFNNGTMDLSITKDGGGYAGGEYRSDNKYSYGYFSVCMKPAKCSGTVSSFFTYTGETDGTPWDEIDIEFLGKDTTKVQFNYYTNGVGNHEYLYDLGFDASKEFHEYGFDWQKDFITWYVDGKAVYTATENIPSHAGRIMMNLWNGIGVDDWLNPFTATEFPITAMYKWAGYSRAD